MPSPTGGEPELLRPPTPQQPRSRDEDRAEEDVRAALALLESTGESRELRIAALRAAIAAGDYRPDPSEVAREILENGL